MLEREFQAKLIKTLKTTFTGCLVLKNDPNYLQGVPDLIVLHGDRWAALEVKKNAKSSQQPNQHYYVQKLSRMGYASFVHPDNLDDVMAELFCHFEESHAV